MALLRVPPLPGMQAESTSLGSCSGASVKIFFPHKPTLFRDVGGALARVADVQRISKEERNHSPKGSSCGSRKKHIPPWRTSWTPIRRRSKPDAPTRDWSNQEHDSKRRSRRPRQGRPDHEDMWGKEGDEAGSSPDVPAPPRTAMARIIEKLRDIEKALTPSETEDPNEDEDRRTEQDAEVERAGQPMRTLPVRTAGELFLPRPNQNIFSIGNYWSTPDHPIPAPGRGVLDTKFPWELEENNKEEEEEKKKRIKPPSLAELLIHPKQLRKLRTAGIALEKPIKIGRLGITDNIADKIIGQWRSSELVKIKCVGPAATNMMKIHKDLERKTGGLVIWRAGGVAVVYRGNDYDTVNKVATSLDTKLDGLLASNQTSGSSWGSVKHVQVNKGSPKDVREGVPGLAGNNEISRVQDNAVQSDPNKDAAFTGKLSSGLVEGFALSTDDFKHTQEQDAAFEVGLQPMEAGDPKGNDMHKISGFKYSQGIPRPNVYPDPFVDRDYEIEIDSILEALGPRCKDWTGATPIPVDADLLPPLIPNYRRPYRLLPYGVRPQLTNTEQTDLRRLIRHITPHFVLGRNKGHQGLAAAILKLWEKSEVVKIAVKAGVQNTSSEKMAEELKRWTGGVLLSRDRYYISLYRGKYFLPRQLALALTERTTMLRKVGDEFIEGGISTVNYPCMNEPSMDEVRQKAEQERIEKAEVEKARRIALVKELEGKLSLAVEKKFKAERDLEMLDAVSAPVDQPADVESITEEEKYMFRRLGLKMGSFLLIGRRGVFDGVVENMHLHWKHRELVKLIVKERDPVQLQKTARMLERESGGVLIAIESTSKGQAIIVYRGKNYQRPENLRPQNLLDKKKALERSLELQRRVSLTRQISALEQEITNLKASMSDSERAEDELLDAALHALDKLSTDAKAKGVPENDQVGPDEATDELPEEGRKAKNACADKQELLKLVKLGPIFRATRLSNLQRLKLRKLALKLGVGSRFNVGKSNALVGLARAIRIHFLKHPLVVIGIKHRGQGTSVQDLVHELEDLTGGVFVSQEQNIIIMYRGWPKGEKMPASGSVMELSSELLAALEAEEEDEDMVDGGARMEALRLEAEEDDENMVDDGSHMREFNSSDDDNDDDSSDDDSDDEEPLSFLLSGMTETYAENKPDSMKDSADITEKVEV